MKWNLKTPRLAALFVELDHIDQAEYIIVRAIKAVADDIGESAAKDPDVQTQRRTVLSGVAMDLRLAAMKWNLKTPRLAALFVELDHIDQAEYIIVRAIKAVADDIGESAAKDPDVQTQRRTVLSGVAMDLRLAAMKWNLKTPRLAALFVELDHIDQAEYIIVRAIKAVADDIRESAAKDPDVQTQRRTVLSGVAMDLRVATPLQGRQP